MKNRPALRIHRLIRPYRVTSGKKFRLADFDPADTGELKAEDKPRNIRRHYTQRSATFPDLRSSCHRLQQTPKA